MSRCRKLDEELFSFVYNGTRDAVESYFRTDILGLTQSKMISNDQELIQSDPTSCPQNQKGNN